TTGCDRLRSLHHRSHLVGKPARSATAHGHTRRRTRPADSDGVPRRIAEHFLHRVEQPPKARPAGGELAHLDRSRAPSSLHRAPSHLRARSRLATARGAPSPPIAAAKAPPGQSAHARRELAERFPHVTERPRNTRLAEAQAYLGGSGRALFTTPNSPSVDP